MKKLAFAFGLLVASSSLMAQQHTESQSAQTNRIISAGSSITELIVALGAKEQLVALDVTSKKYNQDEKLPLVGYHRQLSAEGLMALSPTHLIGSHEMGPDSTLTLLKNGGIDVETVPSGDTEQDLFNRIDKIAAITGTQDHAVDLKASIKSKLDAMQQRDVTDAPKVLFAMLSKGRPATIAGDKTTIDVIVQLAGGQNPAKNMMSSYKPVSQEAMVEMQPDYLLVTKRAWQALGGKEGILQEFPLLAATPAGSQDRIIAVNGSAIIGGLGIESLVLADDLFNQFHPKESQ
ncbi:Hemin-binding periplasmic protein HmuT [Vibrio scophthalmi]|uniref:heme/hemin ABC transporter substrate-binding protein n=1 Tax=Vibrio TaxID=662 RepID=UPI00021C0782|nr:MULTISPECIES: ABC transporter substrate-binding protein [Vibrio]ANS84943.1 Hemin-binding periplasmic protein HmuT [Vibrio scophthalmi]EGU29464.1 hemin ABC transporter, periplasmic hemin-binding protein HutB [Vibrio sp. N418]